ncbi:MAG TPA: neutral/alkaline non-lysosomal ceramidase N-terminal domain-containing protein [Planctomycetota bacterium]|nr:neutral/alkaline non-lysosomal ceramidase N-terminal domain-containing protein [Planctomycetota bacterium]
MRPSAGRITHAFLAVLLLAAPGGAEDESSFSAGAAREDITPPAGLPMWGYGGRRDTPARGTRDPLSATAAVIAWRGERIAIVGLDLGRSPARESLRIIREEVRKRAGVEHVFLTGSHTHHGPCVEVETVEPTAGYVRTLQERIVRAVVRAAEALRPARIGAASEDLPLNRNRHSRIEPKPVDPRLTVIKLEDEAGMPIAVLVNYAAHPTTRPMALLEWSADYPAALRARVEEDLGGLCVFLQGASGDLSARRGDLDTDAFGRKLGGEAVRIARGVRAEPPRGRGFRAREEEMRFTSRISLSDPWTYGKYCLAFFKDLVDAYVEEYREGIRPGLTAALLTDDIGLVAVSGEFFASHAVRLRERARIEHLLFCGYTNGYHQYFPTIEAVFEGGYGADPDVSPVEIGAGERLMDRALFFLHDMRKKP